MTRGTLLALLCCIGCHGRFARYAAQYDAVRLTIDTPSRPDVSLGDSLMLQPFGPASVDTMAVAQMVQENRLERIISEKVDISQVGSAFQFGTRESLSDGAPFRVTDDARPVLDLQVTRWGLDVLGITGPAALTYRVRVMGFRPDGGRFYRATFRCYTGAERLRWAPVSAVGPRALDATTAADMQMAFDRAAYACGASLAERIRRHAGVSDATVAESKEPR